MTIHLGYCRVSTEKQSLDMQLSALRPICDRIWQEKKSGMSQVGRSELAALLQEARRLRAAGESVTICVYSLSRLGRRLVETVSLLDELRAIGVDFKSVTESIDTSTPMGRAFTAIVVALAQAEAEVLSERTKAGLQARKAAGVKLGPKMHEDADSVEQARALIANGATVRSAAKQVGLTNSTLLRRLNVA